MLISEIVQKLNELYSEYGDLPVYTAEIFGGGYRETDDTSVAYAESEKSPFMLTVSSLPNRVHILV